MFPTFDPEAWAYFWYVILGITAVFILFVGYKVGRWLGVGSQRKVVNQKEEELFSAQRGFKQVYDQELEKLRAENKSLADEKQLLTTRVEEYRRKAAGYGGLFNSGGKQADAMYALLLENEALEEALFTQNDKLRQERTDAVKEQLRAASYRRVLMSQLMQEGKITDTARQVMGTDDVAPPSKQIEAHADHRDRDEA